MSRVRRFVFTLFVGPAHRSRRQCIRAVAAVSRAERIRHRCRRRIPGRFLADQKSSSGKPRSPTGSRRRSWPAGMSISLPGKASSCSRSVSMRRPAASCGDGRSSTSRPAKVYHANDPASPTPAADSDGVVAFFPGLRPGGVHAGRQGSLDAAARAVHQFLRHGGIADPRRRPGRSCSATSAADPSSSRQIARPAACAGGEIARRPPKAWRRRWCSSAAGGTAGATDRVRARPASTPMR